MNIRLFLEEIAREAGEITLRYFNRPGLEIITKSDESPVTRADREAEQHIRARIRALFPNDVVLGEEFGTDGTDTSRRWIIDPIDGTKSFIHGVPLYGVLIGYEQAGSITHGVIYIPGLNEIVSAGVGEGCYWNGERCYVSSVSAIDKATVLTTDQQRTQAMLHAALYKSLIDRAPILRTWGDAYGYVLIATGRADLMIDPKMAIWDAAPLGVCVKEAGGAYFDLSGAETIDGGSLVACNGALADHVRSVVMRYA